MMASNQKRMIVGAFVALLVFSSTASAQRGRGYRLLFGTSKADLASLTEVQDDVKLSDEQKTRIAEINDELRDSRRAMFGTGFGQFSDIWKQSDQLNRDATAKVDALLDDKQRERLQQIAIQQNGARALYDPSVVAALGLSEDQKTKVDAARDENRRDFEAAFAQYGREWRNQAGDLMTKFDDRLMYVLSEDQRQKLAGMEGEHLEIDMSRFRGRGGR